MPESGTSEEREQIEYIDIDLIGGAPNNFYELSGLDELAASIELLGLQQPIRVHQDPETSDRVVIVSRHRRKAALEKLVEEGRAGGDTALPAQGGRDRVPRTDAGPCSPGVSSE